jgi:4-hydroxy-tetrahydrodipicolinate synthase
MAAIPTMIVPYTAEGEIDYAMQEELIEYYLVGGCSGLFTVCLSTEMYELTCDERLKLAKFVVDRARGRVPVYASGTFGESMEEMAEFTRRMYCEAHVSGVVVLCSQMATRDDDESVWRDNVEQFLSLVPGIPLGTYECPLPYHRCLSPYTLQWVAGTGRFVFHKDTCCSSSTIEEKLRAIAPYPSFKFYNANVATLSPSLLEGAHGFSGICANFYPYLVVQLCKDPKNTKLRDFLTLAEAVVATKYPQSAKVYLGRHVYPGRVLPLCRGQRMFEWTEEESLRLDALFAMAQQMEASLKEK